MIRIECFATLNLALSINLVHLVLLDPRKSTLKTLIVGSGHGVRGINTLQWNYKYSGLDKAGLHYTDTLYFREILICSTYVLRPS